MKKCVFDAMICLSCLVGCSPSTLEEITPKETELTPLQFHIQMEKEILTFPTTRSMPNNTIPEPSVPVRSTTDAELSELCSTIEYLVFKNETGVPVLTKHKQFVYNPLDLDADFSCIYDSLPKGTYQFYFIAHSSSQATLHDMTFSFDTLSDTFYESQLLQIDVAQVVNKDINLKRIVSRIEFMATDSIPKQLKQFNMEIEGNCNQLDLQSGAGVPTPGKQMISYLFKSEEVGQMNHTHGFYTFVPASSPEISAHLSSIAQNNELIRKRIINQIIPVKNKIIRYKGRLYSRSESDDTFQISIFNNGQWEETRDIQLPDYE